MTRNRIALVCSARSSASKEEGTTNRLLRAAEEALRNGSVEHVGIVEAIRVDHVDAARELIADREIMERVVREIEFECKRLEDFLNAAQVRPRNDSRRSSMKSVLRRRISLSAQERN
jgi:aspartate kinase